MNTETVNVDLEEALVHLESLVAEIRSGQIKNDDEPALAVQLGHVLDHISRAWNCKSMSAEEKSNLSQEEFERLSNTVPNFLGQRVLGEFALG